MFKVLLAASPSFTHAQLLQQKLTALLQNKPVYELHILTQKVFTKMCNEFIKEHNKTHGYVSLHEDASTVVYQRDFFNDGPATTMILYEQILHTADAVIIFWDGETSNEKRLIEACQNNNVKHRVILYKSLKQQLKDAREAIKAVPQPAQVEDDINSQDDSSLPF